MKQAVVFIVDTHSSMLESYGNDDNTNCNKESKLRAAISIVQTLLSNLMLQSKANEAGVILLKTFQSKHHMIAQGEAHLDDIPHPNLYEFGDGVQKPPAQWLRDLETKVTEQASLEHTDTTTTAKREGDLASGLAMALDALYQRTNKKKYSRSIVIVTDAKHDVIVDQEESRFVLEKLQELECRVDVLGMDFQESSLLLLLDQHNNNKNDFKRIKTEPLPSPVKSGDDDQEEIHYTTQTRREQLLTDWAHRTGGSVTRVRNLQEMLDATRGLKLTTPVKTKAELHVAPGLSIPIRRSLLLSKATSLGMKLVCDQDHKKIQKHTLYIDPEEPDKVYELEETARAVRFGVDLIPIGEDEIVTKEVDLPYFSILGYVARDSIDASHWIGPPYGLSGPDMPRSQACLAALCRALEKTSNVALCTHLKTKRGAEILGALLPLDNSLVFLQLPFAGETHTVAAPPGEEKECDADKLQTCNQLVDSLLLPDKILQSGQVRSAFWRSWNQTKVAKVLNKPIVKVRTFDDDDPMSTPSFVSKQGLPWLQEFYEKFDFRPNPEKKKKKKTRGQAMSYTDYLATD